MARKVAAKKKRAASPPDGDAEQRILDAAHAVFIRRGTAGARMQEIADEAGVNKALLHYYFRDKSRLAAAIFQRVAGSVFARIAEVALSDAALEEKVPHIVGAYLDQLSRAPYAPGYVLGELNHHPERGKQLIDALARRQGGATPRAVLSRLQQQLDQRVANGTIKPISAQQFLTNLISLCIFPFAAKPLLCGVMELDEAGFAAFIEERRRVLPEFFLNALRP